MRLFYFVPRDIALSKDDVQVHNLLFVHNLLLLIYYVYYTVYPEMLALQPTAAIDKKAK